MVAESTHESMKVIRLFPTFRVERLDVAHPGPAHDMDDDESWRSSLG